MFNSKVATPSVIKCVCTFNRFGLRNSIINNNIAEACCPRCESVETWDRAVKCSEAVNMRKKFMEKLLLEMLKKK